MRSSTTLPPLEEGDVREAVARAARATLPRPQHAWSEEVALELLFDVCCASAGGGCGAASGAPPEEGDEQQRQQRQQLVTLAPDVAELLLEGAADAEAGASSPLDGQQRPAAADAVEQLRARCVDVLCDHFHQASVQVDDEDVEAFCRRLLAELGRLAREALERQQAGAEGLQEGACALCGRDMPLTKHHLIPRDVHREFKKKGASPQQLQAGVLVCQPCHSAIHRAVPDNRQLARDFGSLEALRQNDKVARFAAWAARQRVVSRADVASRTFRYPR